MQTHGAHATSWPVFLLSLLITLTFSVGQLWAQQPGAIQYFYDDLGRLIKVIDPTGNVAEYVYDAVGNILEIKRSTVTGLALLNFTPSRRAVGTQVTLQGQGFSATPSAHAVAFNGTAATVLAATSTQVVATVPPGATTGPIAVTVAGNTATSDRQFVVLPVPVITSVTPAVAFTGSVIPNFQVQGRNLDGTTFAFTNLLATITSTTIDPAGTSAILSVTVRATTGGTAVVVATNAFRVSSDTTSTAANTLRIFNGSADDDGDGLTNSDEFARGTDPLNPDTDGDGVGDSDEVALGANPLDPHDQPVTQAQSSLVAYLNTFVADTDGDGFADVDEVAVGTNPADPRAQPATLAYSAVVS